VPLVVMYLAKYGDKRAYYYFFGTFALILTMYAAIERILLTTSF
jgi:hypothetical protein